MPKHTIRDEYGKFRRRTFNVTVWDVIEGETKLFRNGATYAEVDEIARDFDDDPRYEVEIEDITYEAVE